MILKEKSESPRLFGRDEVYYEGEVGNQYRRIAGAFSWPSGSKAGCLVILGESRRMDPVLNKTHYEVLATRQTPYAEDLLRQCAELMGPFFVQCYYYDSSNTAMVDDYLCECACKYATFPTVQAPHCDDPQAMRFYASLILNLTNPRAKRLFFGDDDTLPAHLRQIDATKIRGATIEEYPLLSALGFCLSGLETYKHDPEEQARLDAANAELPEDDF